MTRNPVWRAIADVLRGEIAGGAYVSGAQLPTEAVLAERFGVNRHTVRRALAHLAGDGLVHSRRGAGVFVLARPLDYPIGQRVRFHQNLLAAGRLPDKRMLSVEVVAATRDDAHWLDVAEGDAIAVAHSVSYADGVAVALAEGRFPEVRLPGLARALGEETGITRALARVGVSDFTRATTRLTAQTATPLQARHLQMAEGAPLLLAESLNRDQRGRPVEHGKTWFASDRITLTLEPSGPAV